MQLDIGSKVALVALGVVSLAGCADMFGAALGHKEGGAQ